MKLNPVKFGSAFGIIYALVFCLYALAAAVFGVGTEMMKMIGGMYPGVGPTILGAAAGAVWGLVIGFVFFGLAAWIYNALLERA